MQKQEDPMKTSTLLLAGLIGCLPLAGCFGDSSEEPESGTIDGMTVNNKESSFSGRLTGKDETVVVDGAAGLPKSAGPDKTLTLTLVAEIAAPVIAGKTLSATGVVLKANFAYVSYSYQGDTVMGGVESIHLKSGKNAVLRSQVLFDDAAVSAIGYGGGAPEGAQHVYLATTTSDSDFTAPAVVERVRVNGGKFVLQSRERTALNSSWSTSVAVDADRVFVTTGDSGGLHVLSRLSLEGQGSHAAGNARWVDCDDTRVVLAQGMPGRLVVYDKAGGAVMHTWPFTGADVAGGKTTVRVVGGKALVAAGSGGMVLMNLSTGKVVGGASVPVVSGLTLAASVANSADARNDLIFVSNDQAGIYAYRASTNLDSVTGNDTISLAALGKLRFASLQAASHLAFDGNTLVVASGTGGVKIISVKWQ
jgi:hypothetical protein